MLTWINSFLTQLPGDRAGWKISSSATAPSDVSVGSKSEELHLSKCLPEYLRERTSLDEVGMSQTGHEETLSFLPKLWWVDVRQCAAAPHGNYVFEVRMTVQLG
jgi:hypothetical protein